MDSLLCANALLLGMIVTLIRWTLFHFNFSYVVVDIVATTTHIIMMICMPNSMYLLTDIFAH